MAAPADLVAFLKARLDDERAAAEAAFSNQADPENGWGIDGRAVSPHVGVIHEDAQRRHVVQWDPAQVLADLASKCAILDEVTGWPHRYVEEDQWYSCSQAVEPGGDPQPGTGCHDDERAGKPCDCGLARRQLRILLALAQPYAQRPGFDPAWRTT